MTEGAVIWWIRRDLRLFDNHALHAAIQSHSTVFPLFIYDPVLMDSDRTALGRKTFLLASLQTLNSDLRSRGSRLVLRYGDPVRVLKRFMVETGAAAVFAEVDYSPYARRRDREVQAQLPLRLMGGPALHAPNDILKKDGTPYTVFTPYMRAWKEKTLPAWRELKPVPERLHTPIVPHGEPFPQIDYGHTATFPHGEPFPEIDFMHVATFPPGEAAAQERLAAFSEGTNAPIYDYQDQRDQLAGDGTSHLSPYLRFGLLSSREAVLTALDAATKAPDLAARQSAETWLSELIWREFYMSILYHFPQVLEGSYRPEFEHIRWRDDAHDFAAWQQGQTGYPVVDAAMRELLTSGWMHNRARMIAASFLVKNLLIDWRWGERWFMQQLIDGDPAANNGGWQWAAGTGASASPYFRIFNPVLQAKRFDPNGEYIRRFVPELHRVPDPYIHTPWEMPQDVQAESGCIIGRDYPAPIVDLSVSRERALHAYAQARDAHKNEV